jgi:hypothetical protein
LPQSSCRSVLFGDASCINPLNEGLSAREIAIRDIQVNQFRSTKPVKAFKLQKNTFHIKEAESDFLLTLNSKKTGMIRLKSFIGLLHRNGMSSDDAERVGSTYFAMAGQVFFPDCSRFMCCLLISIFIFMLRQNFKILMNIITKLYLFHFRLFI